MEPEQDARYGFATCFSSEEVKSSPYAAIREEIESLNSVTAICALKSRHNSLSNIARLPVEILGLIFSSLVSMVNMQRETHPRLHPAQRWTTILNVCSHWRRVALDTPNLWSFIQLRALTPWLLIMIARSQSAPLDLKIDVDYNSMLEVVNKVALTEIHRIRDLSVELFELSLNSISPFLTQAAPILERLKIRTQTQAPVGHAANNVLPEPFLGGNAPRLRSLHLDSVSMVKDFSMLSKLTTLTLRDTVYTARPSLDEFIETLNKMPNLVNLELSYACNFIPDNDKSHTKAHLPQLRSLILADNYPTCTTLLSCLDYAYHDVAHRIYTFPEMHEGARFQDIFVPLSHLGNILSRRRTRPVRCFRITGLYMGIRQLEAWCDEGGDCSDPPTSAPSIFLHLELPHYDNDEILPSNYAQQEVQAILPAFPLSSLETLRVKNVPLDPHVWKTTFGSLPMLQNISLQGGASDFVEALNDSSADAPFFVGLQNLFTEEWNCDDSSVWPDSLVLWLSERQRQLQKLLFRHIDKMFRSAATKLAHNSTLPSLGGNNDLKPLQDLILAEKQVLTSLQKLSSDLAKSAEALRVWGSGEGDDLGDILGTSSTLIALWASAVSQFAAHGHHMRDYLKSIRTREENLDELKRRRRSVAAKAEAAEKKLSKMNPEHKNLTLQTDSLNALRAEIRSMDSDIMTEEAALGDFKRATTRAWMGLKFGGLLECSEKGTIAGEYGKLIIGEIPNEQTQPGMARSLYYGRNKTEQLLSEAHRCINEVVMSTVPTPGIQHAFPQPPQHMQQSSFQGGLGFQAPQLPINTPQSMFQVPGVLPGGQPPQNEWLQPQQTGDTHSYLPAPQGLGTGQFYEQGGSPALGAPPHQQHPQQIPQISQTPQLNAPYQPEEHTAPPLHSVDDFGVNTASPGIIDQPNQGSGGRFATFPVKNRGYSLSDPQAAPNRESDSFSSSVAQALSSSQSPPGTVPQPTFSYDVAPAQQQYAPPQGPPPGAAVQSGPTGHLGLHHEERNVPSDDEGGLAYMASEDDHHDDGSRHVRFGQVQDVDDELERRGRQAPDNVAHGQEQAGHQDQDQHGAPSPALQPPQYEAIPPAAELAAESGGRSPTSDTRFQNQRRVPAPSVDPLEDERSLNAAAAREVSRELDALHFNPPVSQYDQDRAASALHSAPGYTAGQQANEPLAPPSAPFNGAPSPNTDSPTLPYPAYNAPATTYDHPNQQAPYSQEPAQYQPQPSHPSYDSQSGPRPSYDDPPRLPPLTTQVAPSPYQTPYSTPGEYPRGQGASPATRSSATSLNAQAPTGARTISAAAFKRPQRIASSEVPPSLAETHGTSPLSLKKRLPSSPYPQGREASPIRRGRSGSPALPPAPAPSQALPAIPTDEDDYDYLSAYVEPGTQTGGKADPSQTGRNQGGYGEGRFATDLEGGLR
ncbi:hypothetical protein DXG01_015469 [Tephrocybe rancida]|nr:hypothetical protein DXG01_015469 [Tephrocybe rancida]